LHPFLHGYNYGVGGEKNQESYSDGYEARCVLQQSCSSDPKGRIVSVRKRTQENTQKKQSESECKQAWNDLPSSPRGLIFDFRYTFQSP
jgi:hypothetical protein